MLRIRPSTTLLKSIVTRKNSSVKSKEAQLFKQLFDSTFPEEQRLKFLSSTPFIDEDPSYVIDGPSIRLSEDHPLVTTSVKENDENVIYKALVATPGERSKPLIERQDTA